MMGVTRSSVLLVASAVFAPLGAQAHQAPAAPPVPEAVQFLERREVIQRPESRTAGRVIVNEQSVDPTVESEIRLLADSIERIALQVRDARIQGSAESSVRDLESQLGTLRGRLASLTARLASQQGTRGRFQLHASDLPHPPLGMKLRHPVSPKELMLLLKRVSRDPHGADLPPQDSITRGDFAVAPGRVGGRVAALGQLDVFGTVVGDAVALDGDVIVHKGGHITGDALAVGGTVRLDGGVVDGELRSLDRALTPASAAVTASSTGFLAILAELQTAMGWLVVMVLCGFGAMVFAEDRLRTVAATIESRFGKALFAGILAEVSFIPVLVLSAVLLIVTLIGIVLLPVAIPGLIVLTALLSVLGFLAVSRVAGQALTRHAATVSVRGAELRSMLAGLFFFFGLWLVAAVLSWVPVLGSLLHALAFVVTWAAATVGLGAAVITRGGSRPASAQLVPAGAGSELGWQTPTPISGIAAARRQATSTPET